MAAQATLGIATAAQAFVSRLLLSAAVGFLGASRFADATGIETDYRNRTTLVVFSGIALGILVFVVLFLLVRSARAGIHFLSGTNARPPILLAAGLVGCGTLCVIFALGLSLWHAAIPIRVSSTIQTQPTVGKPAFSAGGKDDFPSPIHILPSGGTTDLTLRSGGSLLFPLLVIGVFLVGTVMIVVGIWGSMKREQAAAGVEANPQSV